MKIQAFIATIARAVDRRRADHEAARAFREFRRALTRLSRREPVASGSPPPRMSGEFAR